MGLRIWICREKGEVLILLFEFMVMHSMALRGVLWDMGWYGNCEQFGLHVNKGIDKSCVYVQYRAEEQA